MEKRPDINTLGFKINTDVPRAPKELLDAFKECTTTDIADVVGKMFTMSSSIRPLYTPIKRTAGSAVTVRVPPGDNLMVHVALMYAGEGDVIVVDARGDMEYNMGGALMCGIAQRHGIQGLVIDGVYRDVDELRSIDFPVYARGVQPKPGRKDGPGEINTVISCAGVPVHPGDIVVADEEGAVVVPLNFAEVVLEGAQGRHEKDSGRWDDIAGWDRDHAEIFQQKVVDLGCKIN